MTRKPAFVRVLDFVGSVPFGIGTMVALLLWCWIGSAGTAPFADWFVRQTFEKTEMEWFSWWPINVLMVLLVLSLTLVTIRKIPFNLPNLGVWTIHTGVVVLVLGSAIYFGMKVEGDMAVFRRAAVLRSGTGEPGRLVLQPGAETHVSGPAGTYNVRVVDLNPAYELLTGDDKGRRTFSAQIMVEPSGGQPFIRQLLAGYPQYTEDVLPGQGRAIKVLGRRIVDDAFSAELEYAPTNRLFVGDRRALHVRFAGDAEWTELPLEGLPRYHEYLSGPDEAWIRPGDTSPPIRPLSIQPAVRGARPELADLQFKVRGFLPYAQLQEHWEPGGGGLFPYLSFTAQAGSSAIRGELFAADPARSRATVFEGVDASFRWLADPAELQRLLHPGAPRLKVRARGVEREILLADVMAHDVAVAGTPYRIRGTQFYPTWPAAGSGVAGAMALVRVSGPGGTFLRSVSSAAGAVPEDIDASGERLGRVLDPSIEIALTEVVEPGLLFVGGAAGTHALLVGQGGQVLHRPVTPGAPVEFLDGALSVTVERVAESARRSERPVIIPRRERDPKAGQAYALIKVEAARGGRTIEQWVEYSHYNYPTRVGYMPRTIRFPGLPPLELLFSRPTIELPAAVALEEFKLEVFPGGTRERDYISLVRFDENGKWSEPQEVHSNNPTEHEGWWYFQSTWDPPDPSGAYAGMNYTGLGVGNRHGVGVLLAGSLMTVLGTLWAFYVKPVILRRRVRTILAAREAGRERPEVVPGEFVAQVTESANAGAGGGRR